MERSQLICAYIFVFVAMSVLFSTLYDLAFFHNLPPTGRYIGSIVAGAATSTVVTVVVIFRTKENEIVYPAPMSQA